MDDRAGGGELLEAVGASLTTLGDRWSLQLVAALLEGGLTFGELRGVLAPITGSVLGERLRRLEAAGVVSSEPYSSRPPRVRYRLAERGRRLRPVVAALVEWGGVGAAMAGPQHSACGHPLELAWRCPRCGTSVAPDEADDDRDLYA